MTVIVGFFLSCDIRRAQTDCCNRLIAVHAFHNLFACCITVCFIIKHVLNEYTRNVYISPETCDTLLFLIAALSNNSLIRDVL